VPASCGCRSPGCGARGRCGQPGAGGREGDLAVCGTPGSGRQAWAGLRLGLHARAVSRDAGAAATRSGRSRGHAWRSREVLWVEDPMGLRTGGPCVPMQVEHRGKGVGQVGHAALTAAAEARPAGVRQGLQRMARAAEIWGCGEGHTGVWGVWQRYRSSTEQACASAPKAAGVWCGEGRMGQAARGGWRQARRRGWHTARSPASGAR